MAMGLNGGGGRRGRGGRSRAPMAEINVTPLVDVMLVLLIIFMVAAPLLKAAVPIELPQSRAKAMAEETQQITITLRRDGAIFYEDQQLAAGELGERLASVQPGADGKMPLVSLRGDKALDYGRVMGVMGELNRAGFTSISLVTDVSGGSGS
ncbi:MULTISPECIES: ExbD/TolR family protein [Novosphingobium]|uniref:ExbD/TolR family protein n=2 Tax=Novosphingobium TaxID=165696 RepID=A0ABT0AC22_9SPHN|nr:MULTISPECIES: ExbD/TolR family protein [Novosphingobium]MCJ1960750.1 ExbD/TolR family protein [Novosphingobium mangrovi (ex Hu et al. 2023)]QVM83649.1 ExbD/TolR family protein [Novosphingobium decolorationis]TYC85033.1 ExbD/TolR family protein [Novosphingobium sp. BW1]GAM05415.1 biopolymer transport protein ExbD/TolR [Novosphingobium sp. MBES04]